MQIKQLTNKKIQFCKAGKIVFSCLPSQNYRVRNSNEIQLISTGQPAYSIFADEITQVSILGGALADVDFNNSQELAEYLDTNFFFESVTVTNIISNWGDFGEYNQGQIPDRMIVQISNALVSGTIYTVPIYLNGTYTEFLLLRKSGLVGQFNFGIYSAATGSGVAKTPDALVYQSPEITTIAAPASHIFALSPNLTFQAGWYFFSIWGNVAHTFTGMANTNTFLGFELTGVPATSIITRLSTAGVYAATLPATHPAGYTKELGNPTNTVLFFKKQPLT